MITNLFNLFSEAPSWLRIKKALNLPLAIPCPTTLRAYPAEVTLKWSNASSIYKLKLRPRDGQIIKYSSSCRGPQPGWVRFCAGIQSMEDVVDIDEIELELHLMHILQTQAYHSLVDP